MSPRSSSSMIAILLAVQFALYFALVGCVAPYWGLFLLEREFSITDIATLLAALAAVRIIAPNLWAWLCYRSNRPNDLTTVAGICAVTCWIPIFWVTSVNEMLVVMLLYGFFWSAILPPLENLTMSICQSNLKQYGRIRLFGSLGFIASVLGVGWFAKHYGYQWLPTLMLVLLVIMLLVLIVILQGLPQSLLSNDTALANQSSLKEVPRSVLSSEFNVLTTNNHYANSRRGFVWRWLPLNIEFKFSNFQVSKSIVLFLLVTILLQIAHGPYYTFFSIYLEKNNYSADVVGLFWSLGVVAEIIIFWSFGRFSELLNAHKWLMICFLLTAVRWLMICYGVHSASLVFCAQILHAVSFGMTHIVSMKLIADLFEPSRRVQAQALYSSLGFGLGGAVGAWISGQIWSYYGDSYVWMFAAGVSLVCVVVFWSFRISHRS